MPVYRLVTLGGLVLLDEDGRAGSSLGPRNLALLAYLARRGESRPRRLSI